MRALVARDLSSHPGGMRPKLPATPGDKNQNHGEDDVQWSGLEQGAVLHMPNHGRDHHTGETQGSERHEKYRPFGKRRK